MSSQVSFQAFAVLLSVAMGEGAAGQRRLKRVEVVVTGADRGTPTATFSSSTGTLVTVADTLDALGNAAAVGIGDSRYTFDLGSTPEVNHAGDPPSVAKLVALGMIRLVAGANG